MQTVDPNQPVLILGGFLITDEAYASLASWIQNNQASIVKVVPSSKYDWLLTSWAIGWRRLLDRVDAIVQDLQSRSHTGKVTLIGHSSGGVMLRLYLGEHPFSGRIYSGYKSCNRLITLGSPHQAVRATPLRSQVNTLYPACFYADHVDYFSTAGRLSLDSQNASQFARYTAASSYRSISDDPLLDGDGLVPVSSALLTQSRNLVLNDTAHGGLFGATWYGSIERIEQWWPSAMGFT